MGVIKRIACTALSAMMMLSFGAIGVNAEALSSSSEDSLSLAWDIVDEADGYVIYRIDDSGELQEIANVEECRYTDEGLEPNTEYNYIVKPYKTEDENDVWLENGEQQISLKTDSETDETISRNEDNSNIGFVNSGDESLCRQRRQICGGQRRKSYKHESANGRTQRICG